MVRVQQIIEFSQFSVVNVKFRRELWIYKIMTSVFDTHPPLIYVTISTVKEIRFCNRYPPTFYVDVTKYAVFFLMASLIQRFTKLITIFIWQKKSIMGLIPESLKCDSGIGPSIQYLNIKL